MWPNASTAVMPVKPSGRLHEFDPLLDSAKMTFRPLDDHLLPLVREDISKLDVWLHPVGPFLLADHIAGVRKYLGAVGGQCAKHVIQMRVRDDDGVDFFGSDTEVA